jgi:Protein of unknown function (DUF3727)
MTHFATSAVRSATSWRLVVAAIVVLAGIVVPGNDAFSPMLTGQRLAFVSQSLGHRQTFSLSTAGRSVTTTLAAQPELYRVPADMEGVTMPFEDRSFQPNGNMLKYIDCYADSVCTIEGVEYTIGVPCDYAVAICTTSEDDPDELIPIEVTDTEMMDELFPIAESIVAEEFGEELVLQRTPQTLTLVGELDLDEDEDEDDYDDEDDDDDGEEVDVMFSFEHDGNEYQLVRLMDPMMLVGKKPDGTDADASEDLRVLLSLEESDAVMPIIEDLFVQGYVNDEDDE